MLMSTSLKRKLWGYLDLLTKLVPHKLVDWWCNFLFMDIAIIYSHEQCHAFLPYC
jgi:hypothetical protein